MTTLELFKLSLTEFNCYLKRYNHIMPTIDNIASWQLAILRKLFNTYNSFLIIIEYGDITTANAILRMICDSVVSYQLIYKQTMGDERYLRHYLFILDGATHTKNAIESVIKNAHSINDNTLLTDNTKLSNNNLVIDFCKTKIKGLNIYEKEQQKIDKIIMHKKWNYKSIEKQESYTWKELYSFLDNKTDSLSILINNSSQFIHGLSESIIGIKNNTLNTNILLQIAIYIMNITINDIIEIIPQLDT